MVIKSAAALLLLAGLAGIAHADALGEAKVLSGGDLRGYDNGCSNGVCSDGAIDASVNGATKRGGLVTAGTKVRPSVTADVPTPKLSDDKEGAINKKGSRGGGLFGSKGFMFGAGGAVVGAGVGFLLGGPIGALIGAAVGGLGGWLLSKFL
jgi:hypothetical protein